MKCNLAPVSTYEVGGDSYLHNIKFGNLFFAQNQQQRQVHRPLQVRPARLWSFMSLVEQNVNAVRQQQHQAASAVIWWSYQCKIIGGALEHPARTQFMNLCKSNDYPSKIILQNCVSHLYQQLYSPFLLRRKPRRPFHAIIALLFICI